MLLFWPTVSLILPSFLKTVHISVGNPAASADRAASSEKLIFVFQRLLINRCILSGCHFSFPSDLAHFNDSRGFGGTATPVEERRGAGAGASRESC